MIELNIGELSPDGKIKIVDKDRLCYQVQMDKTQSIRTIPKSIIAEFVDYMKHKGNVDCTAKDVHEALSGNSRIDRYEYGYDSTIFAMAKMYIKKASQHVVSVGCPQQQIFYGAPGTGKSYQIKENTKDESVIRTTFHPDSDYSTFVGAYKPTSKEVPVMTTIGTKAVQVEDSNGNPVNETKIVYEFVPQAFLNAYIKAWKLYSIAENFNDVKKQFLVIEEINRGNCAQIFGDLFQLLDRNDDGFSDYPIMADNDMKRQLQKAFKGMNISLAESINSQFDEPNIVSKVLSGEILLLPNNLYIWATMNTSDQSLFPIDSAFKRRWDWKYMPIAKGTVNYEIVVGNSRYDWWDFLTHINALIGDLTNCEDKKLGYYFCITDKFISAETFVSKVIFYLWNDVFKDYEFEDDVFKDSDGAKLTFDKFYRTANQIDTFKIIRFFENLGLTPLANFTRGNDDNRFKLNKIIKVNGKEVQFVNAVPYTAIAEYVRLNPEKTVQQIIDVWRKFANYTFRSWIVVNKNDFDKLEEEYAKNTYKIDCVDGSIWVNKGGWSHKYNQFNKFIDAVNSSNLGIVITETKVE